VRSFGCRRNCDILVCETKVRYFGVGGKCVFCGGMKVRYLWSCEESGAFWGVGGNGNI